MKKVGSFSHTVDVPADPETVFWKLLDPETAVKIDSSFEYWRPREWPPKVGTHNDFKAKVGLVAMKGVSKFVDFEPPHQLRLESVKPTFPMFVRITWDLDPISEGTRYTYTMEVEAAPAFGWFARRLMGRYDRQMAVDVPALASLF
jgi:carbon monoxide dehydrogenase subunit G